MGTSGSSKGPGSGTPLVPTWLDEPTTNPLGNGVPENGVDQPNGEGSEPPESPNENDSKPEIQPPPESKRFQSARTNFSRFAKSDGSDSSALRRAVRDYVRSGTRGSANATRRMGSSRVTASGALGVLRGFQSDGVDTTLRSLNLNYLIGRSAEEIFVGLTDTICEDGGSIDEAIARDAWLETVAELDSIGIDNLDVLTADQVSEMFLRFVSHAIETRLFQDIGSKSFQVTGSVSEIRSFEAQFRNYIQRAVRDSFSSDLEELPTLSDTRISEIVDRTYQDAWDILEAWGDAAS